MRKILIYMFLLVAVAAQAQTDRQCIRQGNRLYHQKQWAQAEVEYRKALAKNADNLPLSNTRKPPRWKPTSCAVRGLTTTSA